MRTSLGGYYGLRRVLLKGVGTVGVVGDTVVAADEGTAVVDGAAAAGEVVDEEGEGGVM